MNLVLIGYRGTGKSVVAGVLAARLHMTCVGMDARIVERAGLSIPEIVAKHGWSHFRDLESAEARALATRDNLVVDTGGGVIERPENIEALRATGVIIWLKASVDVIVARIQGGTQRPSLTPGKTFTEEVSEVLARRTPKYKAAAHDEVDTDLLTPATVVDRVVAIWNVAQDRSRVRARNLNEPQIAER